MPDEPSLELPSLFRRKKRPVAEDDAPAAPVVEERRGPALVEEGRSPVSKPPEPEPPAGPVEAPRPPRGPLLSPLPAAILTGAVVGLVTVGLVWLTLRGCSSLRGTSSCGGLGVVVLLAIFVVVVLAGRALLGILGVPDAGSTSFLAMAVVAVVALLFVKDLESTTSAGVLAVVTALAFGVSQWVTSSFTEPGDRPR
jgi:hypothetical protein